MSPIWFSEPLQSIYVGNPFFSWQISRNKVDCGKHARRRNVFAIETMLQSSDVARMMWQCSPEFGELVVNPNCSTHPTKEEDSKHINQDNSLTAQVVSRAQTLVSRASVALQNVTARTQSQQIPLYQTPTGRSRSSFFSRRDEITNPTKGNTSSHSPSSHLEAAQRAVRSHPLWKKGAELLAKAESLGDLTSSRCAQPSLSSKIPTFLSPRKPSSNFFQKNNDIKSKLQEKTRHLSQPNNRVSKSGQSKVEVTRKEESHKRNTAAKKKTSTAVLSAKPVCASSHKRSELPLTTQPVLECENQITKSSFVTLERDSTKGIRKSESCPHYPTKKENFLKETSENHDNKSCTNTVSKKKILRSQQRHNIKSDSELYGDSHLKSVLNILRSNLGPEEKLLAIKQKHDYWEQFSQISLLQKQEKSVQNEETNNCVIEADKSISSHVKQEQILSNSVNDNIYIKKTAPSSEDFSFVDLNVKKHQRCLNVMKTSSYSNIENGSQTNMTKEFNVPAKLDGTENVALSKRRQDTGIQGGEIHCKSANMTKKELKSILKIDVDRLSVEKTTPSQKSPVTVQEWVNSIQLAPGEESRSVEEKQNVCEQLPRSQTEKITPDVPISPTEQLREGSFDDNLYLGAEARNLDGVLQEAAVNRVANSLSPQSRRMSFGDLQSKQSSFNSDFSSYSGISSLSSVESLLEARRGDPEEVLLALGFGGKLPKDPISRIPKRFLLQPSCAKGVKVEDFLKHQEYLLARRVSGPLEFLGVSSQFHLKQQYLRRTCSSSCSFPQVARVSSLELHSTHLSHSGQSENGYKQKKARKSTVTFLDEIDPSQDFHKIPHISVTNPQNVTNLELSDKHWPSESSRPQDNTKWWNKFVYSSDVVISNSSNFSYSSSDTHTGISSPHRVVRSSLV